MPAGLTRFYKMTGSGNDFVMLDGRESPVAAWPVERIREVSDRRLGVGCDGVVILERAELGVRMHYFNSDGSRAAMCGNAALCATRLAARLGLADPAGMTIVADAGCYQSRCLPAPHRAELELGAVEAPAAVPGLSPAAPGERWIRLARVGVPHLLVRVDDVGVVDVVGRGRVLRFDPALGAEGANVNFVSAPAAPGGPWRIRTYERGVEGETLACGTGTVAAGLALAGVEGIEVPVPFQSWAGASLGVAVTAGENGSRSAWLAGEGRLVFVGELANG